MSAELAATKRNERRIIRRLILDALAAGYTLGVHDGEELVLKHSTSVKDILGVMFTVDDEHLIFYDKDGKKVGWVYFIYSNGNLGCDVISDYTTNLEWIMAGCNAVADKLQE